MILINKTDKNFIFIATTPADNKIVDLLWNPTGPVLKYYECGTAGIILETQPNTEFAKVLKQLIEAKKIPVDAKYINGTKFSI